MATPACSPCSLCRSFSLQQSSSTKVSIPELCVRQKTISLPPGADKTGMLYYYQGPQVFHVPKGIQYQFLSESQSPKTVYVESQLSVSILLMKDIKWDFLIQCGNMNAAPRITSVLLLKVDRSKCSSSDKSQSPTEQHQGSL